MDLLQLPGDVPQVETTLTFADQLGRWKARWGIGRMRYRVAPGLYRVGSPTADSPVLVTANYKMSFDRLRAELGGRDLWILVLDTRGINVWCAAGKGTFCAEEVARRVRAVQLDRLVSHRTLILPQLSAPGVAAHEVKRQCGFSAVYGPVRATDLPAFLDADLQTTPEMRTVRFPLAERAALVPMELVPALKYTLPVAVCFFLVAGVGRDGYAWSRAVQVGGWSVALLLAVVAAGSALVPVLLPWLPGRAFSLKGVWVGWAVFLAAAAMLWNQPGAMDHATVVVAWALIMPAVASILAMNFTGASTYTSLSGVRREMRIAVPLQVVATVGGVALWIAGRFAV